MHFILLTSFSNYVDAHILSARLKESGIDCWLQDENVVTINPILTNAIGGIKLMVPEHQFTEAVKLVSQFDDEKKKSFICPHCNSGNIEYISSNREPANWFSVVLGLLFFNYAMPVKIWRCFSCGTEFKEPKETAAELAP